MKFSATAFARAVFAMAVAVASAQSDPTSSPTPLPTSSPTPSPTLSPTPSPTSSPTSSPTASPTTALPTSSPTASPTVLVGCPPLWIAGSSDYDPGTIVSSPNPSTGAGIREVWECREAPLHLFCPQAGYEPGTLYAENAWTRLGKCDSAVPFVSPTTSPSAAPTLSPTPPLWDKVGCPPAFAPAGLYGEGDVVERGGVVYECATWPESARCAQAGWEPGEGEYWTEAWTVLGSCEGTIAPNPSPTTSPSASPTASPTRPLWDDVGCPRSFDPAGPYGEGDVVERGGVVYECVTGPNSVRCSQAGWEPGTSLYWTEAWTVLGSCEGTIAPTPSPTAGPSASPTASPTHPLWDKIGCPPMFAPAGPYAEGDVVERGGVVYECATWPESARCAQAGWEPGEGQYWREAWTTLGSCEGTFSPNPSPTMSPSASPTRSPTRPLWDDVGCPPSFNTAGPYGEGDVVERGGVVYECMAGASSVRCAQAGWEPGASLYWRQAWTILGSCEGTIAPTPSPTTSPSASPTASPTRPLWDKIGCPPTFAPAGPYNEGDVVEQGGVVYECVTGPNSVRCSQAGWEPGTSLYWMEAWTVLGSCEGTIAPTPSPTAGPSASPTASPMHPLWDKIGCPPTFAPAGPYAEGDVAERGGVVYECAAWPNGARCAQAGWEPGEGQYWREAWTALGSCEGTFSPTPSPTPAPTTKPPTWARVGCPEEYDATLQTSYQAGDAVSSLGRVYECKPWPNTPRCNQAGYQPGGQYSSMAWNLLGGCEGTLPPTPAPTPPPTPKPTQKPTPKPTASSCPAAFVMGTTYQSGAEVSANGVKYRCRPWPYVGYCRIISPNSMYGYLGWTRHGSC